MMLSLRGRIIQEKGSLLLQYSAWCRPFTLRSYAQSMDNITVSVSDRIHLDSSNSPWINQLMKLTILVFNKYSGGQPKQGQGKSILLNIIIYLWFQPLIDGGTFLSYCITGGFYGSGGARTSAIPKPVTKVNRSSLLALTSDIERIKSVMDELVLLDDEDMPKKEITTTIKNLVSNQEFVDSLDRLQTADGQPIWGLSMSEHDLIMLARDKVASS